MDTVIESKTTHLRFASDEDAMQWIYNKFRTGLRYFSRRYFNDGRMEVIMDDEKYLVYVDEKTVDEAA